MMSDEFDPNFKPLFLTLTKEQAEARGYDGVPEVAPTFDTELEPLEDVPLPNRRGGDTRPTETLRIRYSELARLHALGYSNKQIARHLSYTPENVAQVLKKSFVKEETERYRAMYFSQTTLDVIKDAALDGVRRIHKMILDPTTKESTALDASKWAAEKATGKPKQEVSVESGTLMDFMSLLKNGGSSSGQIIDVKPTESPLIESQPEQSSWDAWIKDNLK